MALVFLPWRDPVIYHWNNEPTCWLALFHFIHYVFLLFFFHFNTIRVHCHHYSNITPLLNLLPTANEIQFEEEEMKKTANSAHIRKQWIKYLTCLSTSKRYHTLKSVVVVISLVYSCCCFFSSSIEYRSARKEK